MDRTICWDSLLSLQKNLPSEIDFGKPAMPATTSSRMHYSISATSLFANQSLPTNIRPPSFCTSPAGYRLIWHIRKVQDVLRRKRKSCRIAFEGWGYYRIFKMSHVRESSAYNFGLGRKTRKDEISSM